MNRLSATTLGLLIASVILLVGCGEGSDDEGNTAILTPVDLLPADNAISGWLSAGSYEEANDSDSLFDIIDGGAEIFIDNGFVSGAFQTYTSCGVSACSSAPVHVRIYQQDTEADALAVYDKVAAGNGISWTGADMEARIDDSGLDSYTVEFWQRNFFVQVVSEDASDEALNIAKLFAAHISDNIR